MYYNVINPLDSVTWAFVATSVIAICTTLLVVSEFSTSEVRHMWASYISSLISVNYFPYQNRDISWVNIMLLTYGVIFQEYYANHKLRGISKIVGILWVISSLIITSAFVANLKSSLINKTYEDKTKTLDEVVDKDMFVHMDKVFYDYLRTQGDVIPINDRLLCQAKKYNTVKMDGYDNNTVKTINNIVVQLSN